MAMRTAFSLNIKLLTVIFCVAGLMSAGENGSWYVGQGSAVHRDATIARENAIKRACAKALEQAGVSIQSAALTCNPKKQAK